MKYKTEQALNKLSLKSLSNELDNAKTEMDNLLLDETSLEEREKLSIYIATIEEIIENKNSEKEAEAESEAENKPASEFTPPEADKDKIFVEVSQGIRFNPQTGEKIINSSIVNFTKEGYKAFLKNYQKLGYTIEKELYNPYK